MLKKAAITGWGSYVPEKVVTNDDLALVLDTNDAWIQSRTGIRERHIAGPNETTSSMCVLAAQRALKRAELEPTDVDLVICATTTPDHLLPATACLVQQEIGAKQAGAFDLNAACCGLLSSLTVGAQFIGCGTCERVLVVAGETLSRFLDWQDRSTCVLFGDGASAIILEATDRDCGMLSTVLGCRGDVERLLTIEAGGCARPASTETVAQGAHHVRMRGNEVFKLAVRSMKDAASQALARAGLTVSDVRVVIPHQANERIITATQQALGLDHDRVFVDVDRFGNTGATSVGIALDDYLTRDPLEPGANVLLVGFGGGFTWAASVVRWADVPVIQAERRERLQSRFLDVLPPLPKSRTHENALAS
jgi:3-oxoacyl-[acyl-carrier-protein] synthase-3